jgi:hypothetical protein
MRAHGERSRFPEAYSLFSCLNTPMRARSSRSKPQTRVFACTCTRTDVAVARDASAATSVSGAEAGRGHAHRRTRGALAQDVFARTGHALECTRVVVSG